MDEIDWRILNVYSSERCRESFNTLKYEMTLPDFMVLEEFLDISYSYQVEAMRESQKAQQKANTSRR